MEFVQNFDGGVERNFALCVFNQHVDEGFSFDIANVLRLTTTGQISKTDAPAWDRLTAND